MSRAIEIIDPDGERRAAHRRRVFFVAAVVGLAILGYPEAKEYFNKWQALRAGKALALYLSGLRTNAILKKVPIEARFRLPDQIEVYEVTSCGPYAQRTKMYDMKLSSFQPDIEFAPEPWVRENTPSREAYLTRYCYDPLYGSSLLADGLAHGSMFLAHRDEISTRNGEHVVQLMVEGSAGDLSLE